MKMFAVIFVLIFAAHIYSQQALDKIVAIVDNEIILKSELDFQVNLYAAQRQIDPN